eukprot:8626719-Lingulodinium_polyedra.AAC.1
MPRCLGPWGDAPELPLENVARAVCAACWPTTAANRWPRSSGARSEPTPEAVSSSEAVARCPPRHRRTPKRAA